jgi:hypothetical protein
VANSLQVVELATSAIIVDRKAAASNPLLRVLLSRAVSAFPQAIKSAACVCEGRTDILVAPGRARSMRVVPMVSQYFIQAVHRLTMRT